MALSEHDLDKLESILFSETHAEETLDYFGLHGIVCASTVGPTRLTDQEIINMVFPESSENLEESELAHVLNCTKEIEEDLKSHLFEGSPISLPHEDEEDDYEECMESWCRGFMECFFHNEKAWFTKGEERPAELLLPIMALSDLFESEEFDKIRNNDRLMSQFESILADQLTDIYLYYHAE